METAQISTHKIIIYRKASHALFYFIPFGMYSFMLAVFVTNFQRASDQSLQILLVVMTSMLLIALATTLRMAYVTLRINPNLLKITGQGITVSCYPWTSIFTGKVSFLPWSEIEKISCFDSVEPLLAIQFKDAQHWYSLYHRRSRKLRPSRFTGAHIHIQQSIASASWHELIQQIQENYAHEIQVNEVQLVPFASLFTNS